MQLLNLKISKNSLFNSFFFIFLVVQGTNLKLNLSLGLISTFLTLILVLIPLVIIILRLNKALLSPKNSLVFISASLIICSCFLNLLLQVPNYIGIVQTLSFTLPWLLLVAAIMSREYIEENSYKFLDWFNNFIVILIFFGIIEYIACFAFGKIPPLVETANGDFFVGYTTVFHVIGDSDLPHFRFYGPFGEPGELAMWGSILLIYNIIRKNYLYVLILLIALFGAFSPSVFLALSIPYIVFSIKRKSILSFFLFFSTLLLAFIFRNEIFIFYDEVIVNKARSLAARSDNFFGFFNDFKYLFLNHPMGIPFFETTAEKFESGIGYITNFTPTYAFESGGFIAFICYMYMLIFGLYISLKGILFSRNNFLDYEIYIYFLMLATYVVQRHTVFEFAIFPLLFGAIFVSNSKSFNRKINA